MVVSPMMRTVNSDWGTLTPTLHFTLQQDRLQAVGLTSTAVAQQLQFLLTGVPITAVREDIRTVQVVARSADDIRLDLARVGDFTLAGANGQRIPLSQVGEMDVRMEEPIMRRRDRVPTINAHATSTPVGDRGELAAIQSLFGANSGVAIASTKSSTGHLLGAAGGIEAIFTILAIRDQIVPPTLNLINPDEAANGLDLVALSSRKMPITYALSNGFGFGGVNASVLFRRWEAL